MHALLIHTSAPALAAAVYANAINRLSYIACLKSHVQMFVGVVVRLLSSYPLLSAYYHSVYHYKCMHLLNGYILDPSSPSSLMPTMLARTSRVLFSHPSLMSVPWISQTQCLRRSCIPSWSCTGPTVRGCSIASSELRLMRWVKQCNDHGRVPMGQMKFFNLPPLVLKAIFLSGSAFMLEYIGLPEHG